MAKKKPFDVEAGLEAIIEKGESLKGLVPGHEDVIDDISKDLLEYSGKTHKQFTTDDKRVLYRRSEEAIRALLHAKGDTNEYRKQYWEDLSEFRDTYEARLEYVDTLMTFLQGVDRKYFDLGKRTKTMDIWQQAKKDATRALSMAPPNEAQLSAVSYPDAIQNSFDAIRSICKHFYDLYDRKMNPDRSHTADMD